MTTADSALRKYDLLLKGGRVIDPANNIESAVDVDNIEFVLEFVRGDPNNDGIVNVADVIFMLNYLFQSGPKPPCFKSADVDNSDAVDLGDAVYLLNYTFIGGPPPHPPFPGCGLDPTADDLGCLNYGSCP